MAKLTRSGFVYGEKYEVRRIDEKEGSGALAVYAGPVNEDAKEAIHQFVYPNKSDKDTLMTVTVADSALMKEGFAAVIIDPKNMRLEGSTTITASLAPESREQRSKLLKLIKEAGL